MGITHQFNIGIGILFGAAILYGCHEVWLRRQHALRRERFAGRDTPNYDEWYEQYYAKTGLPESDIKFVLDALASTVGVSPTQFLPDDRLDFELGFSSTRWAFDDPLAEFYEAMSDRAGDASRELWKNPKDIRTLDDVIRRFVSLGGTAGLLKKS